MIFVPVNEKFRVGLASLQNGLTVIGLPIVDCRLPINVPPKTSWQSAIANWQSVGLSGNRFAKAGV
jgi:hypothetical protein